MEQLPTHLYTVGEYAALGETEHQTELQEGNIVMSPSPLPGHMDAVLELAVQLRSQTPKHLKVVLEVDIDLGLAPPRQPGTVRRPDVVVIDREAFTRANRERRMLEASDVHVVVE